MSNNSLLTRLASCAAALALSAAVAAAQDGPASGGALPSGRRLGPPPIAIEACAGASKGDACTINGSYGERISGSCAAIGDRLACVPTGGAAPQAGQG
ncbi:MAG: hypothetical protein ABI629_11730 [bacterium]